MRNHLEDLPSLANLVIGGLLSEVARLDERVAQSAVHIRSMARDRAAAQHLSQWMGLGETSATMIVAMGDHAGEFKCGRRCSAWIGSVAGRYGLEEWPGAGASPRAVMRPSKDRIPAWARPVEVLPPEKLAATTGQVLRPTDVRDVAGEVLAGKLQGRGLVDVA